MRHGSNSRRSRGRNNNNNNNNNSNRRPGGNPKMQTFDSNGPDVRIRGNAHQITEKYTALARDASSAGDTILAESYYQHAEHYQRLINEYTESAERQNDPQKNQSLETASGEKLENKVDTGSENTNAPAAEEKPSAPARRRAPARARKAPAAEN